MKGKTIPVHLRFTWMVFAGAAIASVGRAHAAIATGWYTPEQAQRGRPERSSGAMIFAKSIRNSKATGSASILPQSMS